MRHGSVAGGSNGHKDPIEEKLVRRFRLVAVSILLAMVVVYVFAQIFITNFHASEVIFGTMISAILLLLGVSGLNWLTGKSS